MAAEELEGTKPISPRRRRRLLMTGLVIIGAMVVLNRVLPAVLTIIYGAR